MGIVPLRTNGFSIVWNPSHLLILVAMTDKNLIAGFVQVGRSSSWSPN
jgi:hypothetical protein